MDKKLTQEDINKVVGILNDMPIRELNRVNAIVKILNDCKNLKENKDESNKKNQYWQRL